MSKRQDREFDLLKLKISRWIFFGFVVLTLLVLAYINMTDSKDIKLIANHFPSLSVENKNIMIATYKITLSAALIFAYVILIGPFAYLSYFSEHIKPPKNQLINYLSFFDLGILLGAIFAFFWGGSHFVVANSVSSNPKYLFGADTLATVVLIVLGIWLVLCLIKTYSYTQDQRQELKKYMIRF